MKVILVSRCAWTLFNFRRNIALAAKDQGMEVLCVGSPSSDYGDRLEAMGLRFLPIPLSGRSLSPLKDLSTLLALRSVFKMERPDVVHNFTIKPVIYGTLAAKAVSIPVVINTITGLGQVFSENANPLVRKIVVALYRISVPSGNKTFFQNADDLAVFRGFGWFKDLPYDLVAGSGIDTHAFNPDRFPQREDSEAITFIMVTRLLREKGVIEFCEAARIVRKQNPMCRFRLVGGPDLASSSAVSLETLEEYQLSGDVELCGAVDNVVDYLAEADVAVLPSYYREGIPRALLEAGAMGKAIITTDWPGCREAVVSGQTGILVPPRDAKALANAMISLLQHPQRIRSMGSAGRKFAVEKFDERNIIGATLSSYTNSTVSQASP